MNLASRLSPGVLGTIGWGPEATANHGNVAMG
jgi:hypothetical protein